ncbi:MAG: metal ABC transporter permease [Caldilineaceae bacterium]
MQAGLLAAVLVGLTCAVLGVYVVLRMTLLGTRWRTRCCRGW